MNAAEADYHAQTTDRRTAAVVGDWVGHIPAAGTGLKADRDVVRTEYHLAAQVLGVRIPVDAHEPDAADCLVGSVHRSFHLTVAVEGMEAIR